MKSTLTNIFGFLLAAAIFTIAVASANGQTGGQFTIEQSVIANGGSTVSNGGQFTVSGTTGQSLAGTWSYGSSLSLHGGFWQPTALSPTAAMVSVNGRITTAEGIGIKGVVITLTENDGSVRMSLSGPFGYYGFNDITAGQAVVITVQAKRYTFTEPTTFLNIMEDVHDVNFIASN